MVCMDYPLSDGIVLEISFDSNAGSPPNISHVKDVLPENARENATSSTVSHLYLKDFTGFLKVRRRFDSSCLCSEAPRSSTVAAKYDEESIRKNRSQSSPSCEEIPNGGKELSATRNSMLRSDAGPTDPTGIGPRSSDLTSDTKQKTEDLPSDQGDSSISNDNEQLHFPQALDNPNSRKEPFSARNSSNPRSDASVTAGQSSKPTGEGSLSSKLSTDTKQKTTKLPCDPGDSSVGFDNERAHYSRALHRPVDSSRVLDISTQSSTDEIRIENPGQLLPSWEGKENTLSGGDAPCQTIDTWGLLANVVLRAIPMRKMKPTPFEPSSRSTAFPNRPSVVPPTRLHELCAISDVRLTVLEAALAEQPEAASTADMNGRLPLHILGGNDSLVNQLHGREVATAFGLVLMRAYPAGITMMDRDGRMPFVELIQEWLQFVYLNHHRIQASNSDQLGTMIKGMINRSLDNTSGSDSDTGTETAKESLIRLSTNTFPVARLFDEVEWCFVMLSLAMDGLGGKGGGFHEVQSRRHATEDNKARTKLATHLVTTMPTLLKTIFLLEDDGGHVRKRLLKMSIVRRALLCPESVGPWLTLMLGHKGLPSRRAIDYLHEMSQATAQDYVGRHRSVLKQDSKEYSHLRERVFGSVRELRGIIVALLVLPAHEQERAAATPAVWYVMRENLGRPFVVSLVLIDFVLHVVLLVAFRRSVSLSERESEFIDIPSLVVGAISLHYLIRKGSEALSVLNMSRRVFFGYVTNLWTIIDIMTVALVAAAVTWNADHPGVYRTPFNTAVLGLLWVKVLSFLKVINRPLSTFIQTILLILGDLRHFAVILFVIIWMFGDMFHVSISTTENGDFCQNNIDTLSAPAKDFCSLDIYNSFLRVYGLLLGDFELDDYRETPGMLLLFVIFTIIGVIIMLNLIIAIMTDSYERGKAKSILIFGRARVAFVAENQALEEFLRAGSSPTAGLNLKENPCHALVVGYRLMRWLVLLSLVATTLFAEIFLAGSAFYRITERPSILMLVVDLFLLFVLTLALLVVLRFALDFWIGECASTTRARVLFNFLDRCTGFFTSRIATRVFGLNRKEKFPEGIDISGEQDGEWADRLASMQTMLESTLATKEDLARGILSLEHRLCEREADAANMTRVVAPC